jgi:NAD-dependent deacetylase
MAVEEFTARVGEAQAVTVLTGAGISTDSGIPDFRGPQGVWTRDPQAQRLSTLQEYVRDPQVRRRAWQGRRVHQAWAAQPNEAHRALVDLERTGRLVAIITQNIDGLHQRAGSSPDKVVEVHGTLFEAECLGCGRRTPMSEALDRVAAGEDDPPCLVCRGIQKSATISFGQQLNPDVFAAARRATLACDLFLAVGSSLTVQPAASLCGLAVDGGAVLVVVNADPTPYDDLADAVIREPIGTVLPRLVVAVTG